MTMTTGGGKVEAKEGCMIMTGMMITMTAEGKGRAEAKTIDTMTTTEAKGKAKITATTMTTDTAGHQQLPVLVPDHQNVAHLSIQGYTYIIDIVIVIIPPMDILFAKPKVCFCLSKSVFVCPVFVLSLTV